MQDESEEYIFLDINITSTNYAGDLSKPNIRPLLIACSGGAGHITAMKAIFRMFDVETLPRHSVPNYASRPASTSEFFMAAGHSLSGLLSLIPDSLPVPKLPYSHLIQEEIRFLEQSLERQEMLYMDMLLHGYPAGFQQAALWNYFQKNNMPHELQKLVALQYINDDHHKSIVRDFFFEILQREKLAGNPYTEIISTQALGLAGLAGAVKAYNCQYREELVIHQYMTDLPSSGAVHFFNALKRLRPEYQNLIHLYGVNLHKDIINQFFKRGQNFIGLHRIDPKNNPMVRRAFTEPQYDLSAKVDTDVSVDLKGLSTQLFIPANQKIASIMLGGQAGIDSVEYIMPLLSIGMQLVVVFAGNNRVLMEAVGELQRAKNLNEKILILPSQDDIQVASIMSRSEIVITGSGGGTVMEHLAMNHNPKQLILLHNKQNDKHVLSTGVVWEDGNAALLIDAMQAEAVKVLQTTPQLVRYQLMNLFADSLSEELLMAEWDMVSTNYQCGEEDLNVVEKSFFK